MELEEIVDVEAAVNEFCDPNIVVDTNSLDYYMNRLADLYNCHREELASLLPSKDISPFLNALKGHTKFQDVASSCEMFKFMFRSMAPHVAVHRYWRNMADNLQENVPFEFQGTMLGELARMAKDSKAVMEIAANEELLGLIIDRLDNCLVAERATNVLLEVVSQVPGAHNTLFNERLGPKFQRVQNQDTICKLRAYEVYCRMAVISPEVAGRLTPQLRQLVESFRQVHKDVLVQLNYIELLTVLVSSENTIQFIVDSGVIGDMKKLLVDTVDKRAMFLEPGVCEFFGRFGANHPRLICEDYSDILRFMIELTKNVRFQPLAISNLGLMAKSPEGKRCLNSMLKKEMEVLMKSMGDALVGHADPCVKEASLAALSHILELEDPEEDLIALTRSWFMAMCDRPIQAVWDCAKGFNTDLRVLAFGALKTLARLPWGIDALLEDSAGFFEWVLNRDQSLTRDETMAKWTINAAIVENSNKIRCLEKREALRRHFNEGPFAGSEVHSIYAENSR